jgi:hypothetical protein
MVSPVVELRSPRRTTFVLGTVRVRYVVEKEAVSQACLRVLQFSLSVSFHRCFILIFICMLLSPEGEKRSPDTFKKEISVGNRGSLDRKVLSLNFLKE